MEALHTFKRRRSLKSTTKDVFAKLRGEATSLSNKSTNRCPVARLAISATSNPNVMEW